MEIAEGKNNILLKMVAKMMQDQNAEIIQFEKFIINTKDILEEKVLKLN